MVIDQAQQAVIVTRGLPAAGVIFGSLYADLMKEGSPERHQGPFMALAVRLDNGQEVFALPNQVAVPKDGEIEAVREREALAAAEIEAQRAEMWGGGGRVVYTE